MVVTLVSGLQQKADLAIANVIGSNIANVLLVLGIVVDDAIVVGENVYEYRQEGLDHMSAMQIIDAVRAEGGKIDSFFSYCGGLPALESNNNPLGYKFSWSPEGAMLAATNDGRYMEHGKVYEVPIK